MNLTKNGTNSSAVILHHVSKSDPALLPPHKKEVMFLVRSVCLSVCLSVCPSDYSQTCADFDEIFCRGRAWLKHQVIQFWWRSGSRFGSGSPKSEIRILRIAVFGGGLCSLSTSSCNKVSTTQREDVKRGHSATAIVTNVQNGIPFHRHKPGEVSMSVALSTNIYSYS